MANVLRQALLIHQDRMEVRQILQEKAIGTEITLETIFMPLKEPAGNELDPMKGLGRLLIQ